jgi:hypothetical protein
MARRSIALTPNLEKMVRRFQANFMRATNEDYTFNESINFLFAYSLLYALNIQEVPVSLTKKQKDTLESLLSGTPLKDEEWRHFDYPLSFPIDMINHELTPKLPKGYIQMYSSDFHTRLRGKKEQSHPSKKSR